MELQCFVIIIALLLEIAYKIRTSFNYRKQQNSGSKNLRATINFYQKWCLSVIAWNKKHLSKQVLPVTNTLEKKFFTSATFESLWLLSSQWEKMKKISIFRFVWVSFTFLKTNEKLSKFDVLKVSFTFLKTRS